MTEPYDPGPLTKLSVNLTARSVVALDDARRLTEYTATDTVNRALQMYATVAKTAAAGGGVVEVGDFFGDDLTVELVVRRKGGGR